MRLLITGNPGVGKHTCSKLVVSALRGEMIDINRLALETEGVSVKKTNKGFEVDTLELGKTISKLLRQRKKSMTVVVGHIGPYVLKRADIDLVVVLRRSPYELLRTLRQRRYSEEKAKENAASEILGITLYDSLKSFGKKKTIEIDTTGKAAKDTAKEIAAAVYAFCSKPSQPRKPRKEPVVDWLRMVSDNGDIQKFFEY